MRAIHAGLTNPDYQQRVLVEQLDADGMVEATLTYADIGRWRGHLLQQLRKQGFAEGTQVGLVAANGPEWVAADLALLTGRFVEVPVPLAFSAEQAVSLLREVQVCFTDAEGQRKLNDWGLGDAVAVIPLSRPGAGEELATDEEVAAEDGDDRIVKIIHTSGTTGVPKGVKIRRDALDALVGSLNSMSPAGAYQRYLSLVPFSLLIEQVTALYLPVTSGGRVVLLPPTTALLGTAGSRAADVITWLRTARPTAAVLPPAAVSALDKAVRGADLDAILGAESRPFLMAGGAPVDVKALQCLDAAGIRIHEGYGLSENSSVVCWNTPASWRAGTVGKPLPHCAVRLSDRGELLVKSTSLFAGYTVEDPTSRPVDDDGWLHTGDRAEIDADGYVRILGRLKNVIITAHGRNVSPEWVEGRLRTCASVLDAVVFGDGMEHLTAVLVTPEGNLPENVTAQAREFAASHLAETDRPEHFVVVSDNRYFRDRYFTVTGRPRRDDLFNELIAPSLVV